MTETFKIVNGDWVLDKRTGRPVMVTGRDKTRQDIRELLTIDVQPSGYGAGIESIVGRVDDPFITRSLIQQSIRDAISRFQRIQERTQLDQRPPEERVRRIAKLDVYPTNIGGGSVKTGFAFSLAVTTAAGGPAVTISGVATS